MLKELKRSKTIFKKDKSRSKMIRRFIKDQLTSGKTIVYAYRDFNGGGAWVKTKQEEAENFRRNISPVSINKDTDAQRLYANNLASIKEAKAQSPNNYASKRFNEENLTRIQN